MLTRPIRPSTLRVLALAAAITGCKTDDPPPVDQDDPVYGQIVQTEQVAVGSVDCPYGGVILTIGVDDGADGGEAGDGILQEGEIDTVQLLCNGTPGSDTTEPVTYLPTQPPGGADGGHVIDAHGGSSGSGDAGSGGRVDLILSPGSRFGHIKVFRTGEADPSFEVPDSLDLDLGPRPWRVEEDTTVFSYAGPVMATPGQVYLRDDDTTLYRWEDGAQEVSGIHVDPGVTLTFTPNSFGDARFELSHAVVNEGTLTTTPPLTVLPTQPGLRIAASGYRGAPDSRVDLGGQDGSSSEAGAGGGLLELILSVAAGASGPYGVFLNEGDLDLRGGDGAPAGHGGTLRIVAERMGWNDGDILASAGAELDAAGAPSGGAIEIFVNRGPWFQRGLLDASAPDGGHTAGHGGSVVVTAAGILSDADLFAAGGAASSVDCAGDCAGGGGGAVVLTSVGGPIVHRGSIDASGGDGLGHGNGGLGGHIGLHAYPGAHDGPFASGPLPAGSIDLSGDLWVHGGDSALASGSAGGAVIVNAAPVEALGTEIRLLGYDRIELSAGATPDAPGAGGVLFAVQDVSQAGGISGPSGGILNHVDVVARGGDNGGQGGQVHLAATAGLYAGFSGQVVENHGDVDVSGGAGRFRSGGDSGQVWLLARSHVTNTGDLTGHGGDAMAGSSGNGGRAGQARGNTYAVELFSLEGEARNTGDILFSGGDAEHDGGDGAVVRIDGVHAQCKGTLDLHGGDCDRCPAGDGGVLVVQATDGGVHPGPEGVDVEPGQGDPDGRPGQVILYGADVTHDYR